MQPETNQTEGYFASLKKVTPLSKYLALVLFIILPFLGGWIGYSYAPVKEMSVEIPASYSVASTSPLSVKGNESVVYCEAYCLKIATTTSRGIPVTMTIESCGGPECFGSGMTNPETINEITVSNLVSSTCDISYSLNKADSYYVVTVEPFDCSRFDDGKNGIKEAYSETYEEFRGKLLTRGSEFIAAYTDALATEFGPCYGMPQGQCRE